MIWPRPSLSSAAALLGGAAPVAVGFLAQRFGLSWALTSLAVAPLFLFDYVKSKFRMRGRKVAELARLPAMSTSWS